MPRNNQAMLLLVDFFEAGWEVAHHNSKEVTIRPTVHLSPRWDGTVTKNRRMILSTPKSRGEQ